MLVNTNDAFAGINAITPSDGLVLNSPAYDSGTEENDEDCTHIPGPACADFTRTDDAGAGEGGKPRFRAAKAMCALKATS